MADFKKQNTFESRCAQSAKIRDKYPSRVPIIVTRSKSSKTIPDIDRRKYLVPDDITLGAFMHILRKRVKLEAHVGMYLFVGDYAIVPVSQTIRQIDEEFKDTDGYLYIYYAGESTFG